MEKPKQITRLWHTADEQPEVNARGNARICVMRQYGNGEIGLQQTFFTDGESWEDFKFEVRTLVAWAYTDALTLSVINEINKKSKREVQA